MPDYDTILSEPFVTTVARLQLSDLDCSSSLQSASYSEVDKLTTNRSELTQVCSKWIKVPANSTLAHEDGIACHELVFSVIGQRALQSKADADFCGALCIFMHMMQAPQFSLFVVVQKAILFLKPLLVSATEEEAWNFGRFLMVIFAKLIEWNVDEVAFEKEAHCFPLSTVIGTSTQKRDTSLERQAFRSAMFQLHEELTQVLVSNASADDIRISNTLEILMCLTPVYPQSNGHFNLLARMLKSANLIHKKTQSYFQHIGAFKCNWTLATLQD